MATRRFATRLRGKVRFAIGGKQDKLMHTRNLPHSHVTIKNGKKSITRYPKKKR